MYFKTDTKTINFDNESEVTESYNQGFVFTRLGKGEMIQTRSLRIDLSKFELTSENRRILKKVTGLRLEVRDLPLENYSWEIHKLGKDFYSTKFGDHTMSATKIKEMFTEPEKSNMNLAIGYELRASKDGDTGSSQLESQGYCLCYENSTLLHYAYPFYDLEVAKEMPNLGLGMMINATIWAKENNKKYVYLGSVVDPSSKYKLQFEGLEWWDAHTSSWSTDIAQLKNLLGTEASL